MPIRGNTFNTRTPGRGGSSIRTDATRAGSFIPRQGNTAAGVARNAQGSPAGGASDVKVRMSSRLVKVPPAPRNVAAVAGSTQAVVTWDDPLDDGGSVLTGYKVSVSPADVGPFTIAAGTKTKTITGLTASQLYTVTVKATNVEGDGAGATTTVTPTV